MQLDLIAEEVDPREESSELVTKPLNYEPELPLFLRDWPEGRKDNAQDEKDKTGE